MICPSCNQNLTKKNNCCPKCNLIVPWADSFVNELSFYKWTTDLYSIKSELKGPVLPALADCVHIETSLHIGTNIHFGTDKTGKAISWKVLSIENQTALIISENIICSMPYHKPGGEITWSDCSLRKWLNNDFIKDFLNQTERERLIPIKLVNYANPRYLTPGGDYTIDKVFLLSIGEAKHYFSVNAERSTGSLWWLRSPGFKSHIAALVDRSGKVYPYGYFVNRIIGVRPAMWINVDN